VSEKTFEEGAYIHVVFKQKALPLTGYELEETLRAYDGTIKQVLMHFPDGCNALVDVAVCLEQERLIPRGEDEYVALDGSTPIFPSDYPIKAGQRIRVYINNHDETYPHTITVIISIKTERR